MIRITMLWLCLILFIGVSRSQNVGIGVTVPAEKLDVNGNINVQGNIKVNGVAGQNGQSLMTNNAGAMVWGFPGEYKNIRTIEYTQNFSIPPGVTTIFVEIWGGGGGGAVGGGGGSGGYVGGYMNVGAATSAEITIGNGGMGALTIAHGGSSGNNSTIVLNGVTFLASGGSGGWINYGGSGGTGNGINAVTLRGHAGQSTTEIYVQRTSTQFVTSLFYGHGGSAPNTSGTGAGGGFRSFDTNNPSTIINTYEASDAVSPGGGGGGGLYAGNFGSPGANGLVIIRW